MLGQISLTTDATRFADKVARGERSMPQALKAYLTEVGHDVVKTIIEHAPRDTTRFVRGYAEAGNAAGVGPFFLPPLQKSRRAIAIENAFHARVRGLAKTLRYWAERKKHNERLGGTKSRREASRIEKKIKTLSEALNKATREREEFLRDKHPHAVVIHGRPLKPGQRPTPSHFPRVLLEPFGGTGALESRRDRASLVLRNLEPHASIVNKHTRVVSRAVSAAGRAGTRRASRKALLDTYGEASGLGQTVKSMKTAGVRRAA